jgi:hypothetical protein
MKDTSYIKILTLKNQSNVDKKTIEIKKKKKKERRKKPI